MSEPIRCVLATLRRARGLTQLQLAGRVGLTQPHLCQMEHGVAPKGLVNAYRLAAALQCDVRDIWPDLVSVVGEPPPTTATQHRVRRGAAAFAEVRQPSLKNQRKRKR